MHLRVDDDDVVEALGQPLLGAHEVDGVADRPVLGRDHDLALHQPPGRILAVLQRRLDRRPVRLVERPQDPLLLRRVHVLGEIDDVVGLELRHRRRQHVVGQLGDDLVAHPLLELRQHPAVELLAPEPDQRLALGPADLLEQVGDVGLVQRLQERHQPVVVAGLDRVEDRPHHLRGQRLVRGRPPPPPRSPRCRSWNASSPAGRVRRATYTRPRPGATRPRRAGARTSLGAAADRPRGGAGRSAARRLRCCPSTAPRRCGRPAGSPAPRWSASGSPPRRW